MTALIALLLLAVAACGAPADPGSPAGAVAIALVGAQLIDGTGADPVPDAVVIVQDGRISAAGTRADTAGSLIPSRRRTCCVPACGRVW